MSETRLVIINGCGIDDSCCHGLFEVSKSFDIEAEWKLYAESFGIKCNKNLRVGDNWNLCKNIVLLRTGDPEGSELWDSTMTELLDVVNFLRYLKQNSKIKEQSVETLYVLE